MVLNRERSKKAQRNRGTSFLCSNLSGCSSLARGDTSLKAAGRTRSSLATKEEVGRNGGVHAGDAFFFPNFSIENIARRRLRGKNGVEIRFSRYNLFRGVKVRVFHADFDFNQKRCQAHTNLGAARKLKGCRE